MADAAPSKEEMQAKWWAAWWREDFTWAGLATKDWQGWSVTDDGFVVETESGARYGAPNGAAAPSPPQDATSEENGGGGAAAPNLIRDATLQDYWRADPATGRLRSDAEMMAAGELVFQPPTGAAAAPPPLNVSTGPDNGDEDIAAPDGAFHIIHLPLTWKDGTPTGKADWANDALDLLIAPRLEVARETNLKEPDHVTI